MRACRCNTSSRLMPGASFPLPVMDLRLNAPTLTAKPGVSAGVETLTPFDLARDRGLRATPAAAGGSPPGRCC